MTSTVTTRADADRVAGSVRAGLISAAGASFGSPHCRTPVRWSGHDQHGDLPGRRGPRRREVADGLSQLADAEYWKFPGDDLLDAARSIERLARQVYAVQVAVAGEIDLARLAQTHGQPSTAALLRHALTIGPGDARGRVRTARQVLPQDAISGGEIPPRLPELGDALRDGDLGGEQTAIVVKTMSRIPTDIPPEVREQAETTLVDHARVMDPIAPRPGRRQAHHHPGPGRRLRTQRPRRPRRTRASAAATPAPA